jgi:hypothetical protein
MSKITLNKTFRSWIELWGSLSDDLNTMFTELYSYVFTDVHVNTLKLTTPLVTTPVTTVTVDEYGDGRNMTTVLTLTNFIIGALSGTAADKGIGNILAAFPAGFHVEDAYYQELSLKCAGTAVNTDTGLGSVIASGVVSILSGTGTFEDRLTGQTIPTAAAGGTLTEALVKEALTGISVNVSSSVKNLFLNSAGTWNANNTGNLTATGKVIVKWAKMS